MDAARTALRASQYDALRPESAASGIDSSGPESGDRSSMTEAFDAARTAARAGAKQVTIISLESRDELPAHEFEADNYAACTTGAPEALVRALKKLSLANLSNLTPHPALVFLSYSHPPVLERIRALRSTKSSP